MLTCATARAKAVEYVQALGLDLEEGDALVVLDASTIERSWGWVFFYTSKLWLETREVRYVLAGNAPILIERESGTMHVLGTARPIEAYIASYERTGDPHEERE